MLPLFFSKRYNSPLQIPVAPAQCLGPPSKCAERYHFFTERFRLDLPAPNAIFLAPLGHVSLECPHPDGVDRGRWFQNSDEVVKVGPFRNDRIGGLGPSRDGIKILLHGIL